MAITDELREWFDRYTMRKDVYDELTAIADRIDAEHEKAIASVMNDALYHANDKDMADLGWVRLPKDANGEYIRIGDVMENVIHPPTHREVTGVGVECFYAWEDGCGRYSQFDAKCYRHHHKPTVEDVLRDMLDKWGEMPSNMTNEAIVTEYAAKLRLAGDAE